jgi:NAD(P)-dependent dehydrogenase (short-subunit alcohol dehydrogenase family)
MKLADKVVVVTGGASGIGRAMVQRFAKDKPRAIVVSDRDLKGAEAVAKEVGGDAIACDVGREAEIQSLIGRVREKHGVIDLFCANAGIAVGGGVDTPDSEWDLIWRVNFMSHVWTARALLPDWEKRKSGYLLHTSSAAGLLTMVGAVPYSVTKHAVVSLAEWLAITYGDKGIKISCLCPLFVNTPLMTGALSDLGGGSIVAAGNVIEPPQVADAVVEAIDAEKFLILPHPEVATFFQRKATDYDRWLNGMRRLQALI